MEKTMRIPYGISNFQQVRRENLYYADKTMFLERMEDAGHFLFLARPRRFGKSIFLSMMCAYYDINERERFDALFGGLYVHDHPTEEHNRYQVLFLDLSQVAGDSHSVQQSFEEYGCNQLDQFAIRYSKFYSESFADEVRSRKSFANKLTWIATSARNASYDLYLIVDEYDNFTNNILNQEGTAVYRALTHASGFYRSIFKLFKPNFSRILMMGVSPVTLDDLTSGYNIAMNITSREEFNMMLGFSESEVRTMIRYYRSVGALKMDEEAMIADMKPWYDNYCFAEAAFHTDAKMFNCDMVCYYVSMCIHTGRVPKQHLDPNTKTDYKKMKNLVLIDKLDPERMGVIRRIANDGYIYGDIKASFPAEALVDKENFVSLLYYYGMITITGVKGALLKLGIPNNNVRLQYYEYLKQEYNRVEHVDTGALDMAFYSAAYDGDWRPVVDIMSEAYANNSSVRSMAEGERNIQGFWQAYLSFDPYYMVSPEVEMAHGYCDFFLLPELSRYPGIAHSYILELKYLKSDAKEAEAERQWQEAEAQIRRYATSKAVQRMTSGTKLHLVIVQIKGYRKLRAEEAEP